MELDNRGLLPPEPMVRIMAAIEKLPDGEALNVLMDRRPLPLYAILEAKGYNVETTEVEKGVVQLTITRR